MIKFVKNIDLSKFQLIIPSVSVGNVGQLSVDLLVRTLRLTKIGYVWHQNITPVCIKDDNSDAIVTACELFASEELKIVILQIRSTFGPFVTISSTFKELCGMVKCVVIVTGSFSYERKDIQLVQDNLCYLASDNFITEENFKIGLPVSLRRFSRSDDSIPLRIPGAGIADHLYELCIEEKIPVLLLVEFVSEGDNRIDAEVMANCLDSLLLLRKRSNVDTRCWTPPAVWDSLFGNTFPSGIF